MNGLVTIAFKKWLNEKAHQFVLQYYNTTNCKVRFLEKNTLCNKSNNLTITITITSECPTIHNQTVPSENANAIRMFTLTMLSNYLTLSHIITLLDGAI